MYLTVFLPETFLTKSNKELELSLEISEFELLVFWLLFEGKTSPLFAKEDPDFAASVIDPVPLVAFVAALVAPFVAALVGFIKSVALSATSTNPLSSSFFDILPIGVLAKVLPARLKSFCPAFYKKQEKSRLLFTKNMVKNV